MQRPNLYETLYAHDRRAHRHRCQCCHKIINAGEPVVMWAIHKATRALHLSCADRPTWEGGPTQRELAQLHSDEHARKLGFRIPESQSARKGSEKLDGLQSDHRGITQARSSECGNDGTGCARRVDPISRAGGRQQRLGRRGRARSVVKATCVDPAPVVTPTFS